jgi:DNA-binding transcriptional LysR family regulator
MGPPGKLRKRDAYATIDVADTGASLKGAPPPGEAGQHDMTPRELRIFLTICEARSLSKAAERLAISQPSLSRTIRTLEERFRLRFFARHGRGVELTAAGKVLRDHAARILNEIEELNTRLDDLHEEAVGSVSVLLPVHVSHAVTPSLVKAFAAKYPKAAIHVFEDSNPRIADRVKSGEADFGLNYETADQDERNSEMIATEDLYLIGLPGELGGSDSDPIDFAAISGTPLVLPRPKAPYRQFLEACAARCGIRLTVVRELEMGSTLLAFVLEREGATILPISHCHEELRDGQIVARRIENPRLSRRMMLLRAVGNPNKFVRFSMNAMRSIVREKNELLQWNLVGRT